MPRTIGYVNIPKDITAAAGIDNYVNSPKDITAAAGINITLKSLLDPFEPRFYYSKAGVCRGVQCTLFLQLSISDVFECILVLYVISLSLLRI